MPLLQYFGWVGSFLVAALFATNWCCSAPITRAPLPDVPLDQKINIRIHTDHKWPERVILDTTRATPVQDAKAHGETDVGENRDSRSGGASIPRRVCGDGARRAVFSIAGTGILAD